VRGLVEVEVGMLVLGVVLVLGSQVVGCQLVGRVLHLQGHLQHPLQLLQSKRYPATAGSVRHWTQTATLLGQSSPPKVRKQ
jgi:hypothetical protein